MQCSGRLDKLLYVPLPSPEDRAAILKTNAKKLQISPDVDLDALARSPRADGYSGADCAALLREAGLAVLRDNALSRRRLVPGTGGDTNKATKNDTKPMLQITNDHFDYAFDHVMPSVSKKDQARYDRVRDRMASARSRGTISDEQKSESGKAVGSTSPKT